MFQRKNFKDPRMAAFWIGAIGFLIAVLVTPSTPYAKSVEPDRSLGYAMAFAIITLCIALVAMLERLLKIKNQ